VPAIARALTGRIDVVRLWPLSQGEIESGREDFVAVSWPTSEPGRGRS
jgi:hypothetical protein